MIVDCILYNGEKELLEIRLNETKLFNQDVVTVACCSTKTHTGLDKLDYGEDFGDFKGFQKLVYTLSELEGNTPREREAFQRNSLMEPLQLLDLKDDDIVLIDDVDEIPRARAINIFPPQLKFASLLMDKYAYRLGLLESEQSWDRGRIMTWEYLKDRKPEEVRNSGYDFSLHHAGWHYSWVCDPLRKLKSFSHTELDTQENIIKLDRYINFWNEDELRPIEINLSHPEYLYRNQDKFKHII